MSIPISLERLVFTVDISYYIIYCLSYCIVLLCACPTLPPLPLPLALLYLCVCIYIIYIIISLSICYVVVCVLFVCLLFFIRLSVCPLLASACPCRWLRVVVGAVGPTPQHFVVLGFIIWFRLLSCCANFFATVCIA